MTAITVDELDRLVQENTVLGTMDADARRQLRDALEPVAVPARTDDRGGPRPGVRLQCCHLRALATRRTDVSNHGSATHPFG